MNIASASMGTNNWFMTTMEPKTSRPRTRWRMFPAAILVVFGGFLFFVGASALLLAPITLIIPGTLADGRFVPGLIAYFLMSCAGAIWVLSGMCFWRKR